MLLTLKFLYKNSYMRLHRLLHMHLHTFYYKYTCSTLHKNHCKTLFTCFYTMKAYLLCLLLYCLSCDDARVLFDYYNTYHMYFYNYLHNRSNMIFHMHCHTHSLRYQNIFHHRLPHTSYGMLRNMYLDNSNDIQSQYLQWHILMVKLITPLRALFSPFS